MAIIINVTDKYDFSLLKTKCKLDNPKSCGDGYACPAVELLMTGPYCYRIGGSIVIHEDNSTEYICHISSPVDDIDYIDKAELTINKMCYACENRIHSETKPGVPGQFEAQIYHFVTREVKRLKIQHPSPDECPAICAERAGKTPTDVIAACTKCRGQMVKRTKSK